LLKLSEKISTDEIERMEILKKRMNLWSEVTLLEHHEKQLDFLLEHVLVGLQRQSEKLGPSPKAVLGN
jgi:hypothetical protein